MLESPELIRAGLAAGLVHDVYVDADEVEANPRSRSVLDAAVAARVQVVRLASGVLAKVTDAVTPQSIVATATPPIADIGAIGSSGFVLVLSGVTDPGNLGTAIRSAHAAGAAGVVVCGAGVDVCNPKALRATAGSIFHVPVVVRSSTADAIDVLRATGRRVLGAVVGDGPSVWSTALKDCSVLIGSEASGLDASDVALLDGTVRIPMDGAAESLNAGVAASIICFEALRQRAASDG